jgi:hypothetical protein
MTTSSHSPPKHPLPQLEHRWPHDYLVFGYDRLHVWLDRDELPLPVAIQDNGTTIELHPHPMKYHALWKLQLQLRQPSRRALEMIETALGHEVRAMPNYVEIVLDVLCDSKSQARLLQRALIASVRMKHQPQSLFIHKGTAYIGRRAGTAKARKAGHVLAVYSDRPSKLNAAKLRRAHSACLHIEWRATGARALEMLGIVTTRDLLDFDHRAFWAERLQLFVLPERKTELGRILHAARGKRTEVTDRALRANASRWTKRNEIDGQFAMHNALLGPPVVARRLETVPIGEWLKREISRTEKSGSNSALKTSKKRRLKRT